MKYFSKPKKENSSQKPDPSFIRHITDSHVAARLDKELAESINADLEYVKLDKETFNQLFSDMEKFKKGEKALESKNKELEALKKEIADINRNYDSLKSEFSLYQQNSEQEKSVLLEKIREVGEEVEKRDKVIAEYEDHIKHCEEELGTLDHENHELAHNLEEKAKENQTLLNKISDLERDLEKVRKFVRAPQSNIVKVQLHHIFYDTAGEYLVKFLDDKDILSLTLVNKEVNKSINSKSTYYKTITEKMLSKLIKTNKQYLKRINYWGDLTKAMPEPYLKHVYAKYLLVRETIGEYSLKTIIQGDEFFKMLLEAEEKPKKSEGFLGLFGKSSNLENPPVPQRRNSTEIVSRMVIPSSQHKEEKPNQEENKDSNTLIERTSRESSEELASNINVYLDLPTGRDVFNQYQDPRCIFIASNSMQYQKDDKKLFVAKGASVIEEMLKYAMKKKNALADNPDLLSVMLQVFIKLLVHCKLLLQEGKELETVKDYLAASTEEVREQLANFKTMFEDHNETMYNERNLKEYFRTRCAELEGSLHNQNAELLKDSEGRILLENKLKTMEVENEKVVKEKVEIENKLRVLAKEFKGLRVKNSELEASYKSLTDSYVDIKITFDNLQLEDGDF